MGKTGKALKKRRLAQFSTNHLVTKVALDGDDDLDSHLVDGPINTSLFLGGAISESQLSTTVNTLARLSESPELITQFRPQLKRLRGAVFDFQRVAAEQEGTGTSLTSRVSSALTDQRWTDAKVLLAEMRIRRQRPKLGALQRWTRECDAASTADGSDGDREVLGVLDAIMRTAEEGMQDINPVKRYPNWTVPDDGDHIVSTGLFKAASDNTLFGALLPSSFVVYLLTAAQTNQKEIRSVLFSASAPIPQDRNAGLQTSTPPSCMPPHLTPFPSYLPRYPQRSSHRHCNVSHP